MTTTATRRLRDRLAHLHAVYERKAELAAGGDSQARATLLDLGMRLFALKREIDARRRAAARELKGALWGKSAEGAVTDSNHNERQRRISPTLSERRNS